MTRSTDLADAIIAGDRKALARAITLVESLREEDALQAEQLLQVLLPHTGRSRRVGITGAPGVGKSTFIEALGLRLCAEGRKVAVLAVDPSSSKSGGSILGDKTRMNELSRHANAFIRPSPGGGTLGGVTARTREALLMCEAAGFDVVLVETIGTGQSETAVHGMVDFFLLLLSPAAGDELQGIKRGVMELADGVLVHKADGDLAAAANHTAQHCRLALHVLRGAEKTQPPVITGSSYTGDGLEELWREITERLERHTQGGELAARRRTQAREWLDTAVRARLLSAFLSDPAVAQAMERAQRRVERGELLPAAAARELVARGRT